MQALAGEHRAAAANFDVPIAREKFVAKIVLAGRDHSPS
jgi:hypothetical protein